MANLARFVSALWDLDTFYVFDDFWMDQTDLTAVDTITDTGTALMGDEANGVATLTPSDGSVADNDEVYLATPNESFLFAANRELYFKARVQFAETTAGVYNVAFGAANAPAANLLIDTGGGLRASGSLVSIYKVTTESVWRCTARSNSVVTITQSAGVGSAAVAATWYVLEITVKDVGDGVNLAVSYKVDGVLLRDSNGYLIRHIIPVASATEMAMFFGAKLGAATNNDAAKIDYWFGAQSR